MKAGVAALMALFMCMTTPAAAQARKDGPSSGRLVKYEAFASTHADPRNITVWLPEGYDGGTDRYAVLYMHDGQNLFEADTSYGGQEWGIDEALTRMMAEGKARKTIVVGIWNTPKRWLEYYPAEAFRRLPEEMRKDFTAATGSPPLSDGYLRFIVEELKPFIDKTYRTLPDRANTTIMGSSMGGLISLYAAVRYPDVFAAAGCVSTHWPMGQPDDKTPLGIQRLNAMVDGMMGLVADGVRPSGPRIYFDFGTTTLDSYYEPYQRRVDGLMEKAGFTRGRNWMTEKFEGAAHNEVSWRERVHIPLAFLLAPGR